MLESTDNVCGPPAVTLVNYTRVLEWYVVRLVVKNVHQKHTCYDKTRRYSQIYQPFIANGCVSMNLEFLYHPWCQGPCNPLLPIYIYDPPLLYMNQLYYEDPKICISLFLKFVEKIQWSQIWSSLKLGQVVKFWFISTCWKCEGWGALIKKFIK